MIYISKPVVFKKQSETLTAAIKDKQLQAKKKKIKSLAKVNAAISEDLIVNKNQYEKEKENYENKYSQLLLQQKEAKQSLLKLQIRKRQLEALQDPQINNQVANQLKRYLKGWAQFRKHKFIQSIQGLGNYKIAKKFSQNIETIFYIRPQIRSIVLLKRIKLFNDNKKFENVMVCVKKVVNKQNSLDQLPYRLQIYSIIKQYFYLSKDLNENDFKLISYQNPVKNLIISVKNKTIFFLHQYFKDRQNKINIQRAYKTFMFKMILQKERKKIVYFKRMTINNIFQTIYGNPGFENLSLDVLIMIKKRQPKKNTEQVINYSNGSSNSYGKGKEAKFIQDQLQNYYTFYCQPVKSYESSKLMFSIQDEYLIRPNSLCTQTFVDNLLAKHMIQLEAKISITKQQFTSKLVAYSETGKIYGLGTTVNLHSYFHNYKKYEILPSKPRIVKTIQFSLPTNLAKVIKIQLKVKAHLQKRKYQLKNQQAKKNNSFDFCVKIDSNLVASAYLNQQFVIFFVQCLDLGQYKIKQNLNNLKFPRKYWNLAKQFMNQIEFANLLSKGIVWQVKEKIKTIFQKKISQFQKIQNQINKMKPIKQTNRLRKLFILAQLRQKIRNNTLYVKKIQKQFASLVLIIRKSRFLKNIVNVHLYTLKIKNKQNDQKQWGSMNLTHLQVNGSNISQNYNKKSSKQIILVESQKLKYNQISLYAHNAEILLKNVQRIQRKKEVKNVQTKGNQIGNRNIQNEFYITEKYFLLKPFHIEYITNEYKFIERFASINLNSDEIVNQFENLSFGKSQNESYGDQKAKRTRFGQKSHQKIGTLVSVASIVLEKQFQSQISRLSQEQNLIFYSLYKDSKGMFYLQLFAIVSTEVNDYFQQVHKEQISKKQISSSGWTLIYKLIASWAKNSGWSVNYEERKTKLLGRQSTNMKYQKSIRYKSKSRYSADSIIEANLL